jgi:hypothetical protein
MTKSERETRIKKKLQYRKPHRTSKHAALKGARVQVGNSWELDLKESKAPTRTATREKAILFVLSVAGLMSILFTIHAVLANDKGMITQGWNTAQSVLTAILIWALGQNRAEPKAGKVGNV